MDILVKTPVGRCQLIKIRTPLLLAASLTFAAAPPPPGKVPGFAKYAVEANLFRLEFPILTQATNRNNVATEKRGGGIFRGVVYLEPIQRSI